MPPEENKAGEEGYRFPIEWKISEEVESKYATNLQVQHTNNEFIINFFEARPPIIAGSEEEKETQLKEMSSVEAKCIARILVSPGRMPGFIDALQDNFEKYLSRVRGEEKE